MNRSIWLLPGCAALLVALFPALALGAEVGSEVSARAQQIPLVHKTVREWDLNLPAERFVPVGTGFKFAAGLGSNFAAKIEGTALLVDTDGDGETDVKADGKDALITLNKDGVKYALRLVNQRGWKFAPAGTMTGKIGKTKIRIIDQNCNGFYGDFGEDAMILGRGKAASFLSRVINVEGDLYEIDVAKNGTSLSLTPFTGESGTLSLADCKTKAKVLSAVVVSEDGRLSFDMSGAKNGMKVPAGNYSLFCGELGLGESRTQFRTGRSKLMTVTADSVTSVGWGGPVMAEFAYKREGEKVHLSPDQVWYYGDAGEQYHTWTPIGKSPKFTLSDKKTGREIAQAYFPGTC